jgi:hypothetical protein
MTKSSTKERHGLVASLTIIVACSGALNSQPLAPPQSRTEAVAIGNFIAKQMRTERANEYEEARLIARGDLNRDGTTDTVVLYTLENQGGTNQYLQYLAVFKNQRGGLAYLTHKLVGGKNRRAVESVKVEGGKIILQTLDYLPTDASCCPSKKGHAQFILNRKHLKEL